MKIILAIKEWNFPALGRKKIMEYAKDWDLSYILAAILCSKGFKTKEKVNFFFENEETIMEPFLFDDMDKIVDRINKAIENFEKICVYGDYDADGITSTVLMYSYLKERGANVTYRIPSRYFEGYGLNKDVLLELQKENVNLIITVDNGISAAEEIDFAKSIGIEIVVTDHHMPREIPNACAVVDPHRNKDLKFTDYAGVGVVFKVIEALEKGNYTYLELIEKYGDIVAIGIIGDVVPLLGENRILVIKGLESLNKTNRPGTKVLLNSKFKNLKKVDSVFVSFNIVPKINSCGRTGSPKMAAKLFLAETDEEANDINDFLIKENENRKTICENVFKEVEETIEKNPKIRFETIIFAQNENWNRGVLGIVASKVMVKYGKPTILFSIEGEEVRGSARSIPGFSMFDAVSDASIFLERFGGHPMAAGMNLKKDNLENFKKSLLDFTKKNAVPNPSLNIDCILNINEITIENILKINSLKPFGAGNFEPVFGMLNVKLINIYPVSENKFLKLMFSKNNETFYAMYFVANRLNFFYSIGDILDIAFNLRTSIYFGSESVLISIKDIKYSFIDTKEIMRQKKKFENFMTDVPQDKMSLNEMLPSREDITIVYKVLNKNFIGATSVDVILKKVEQYDISLSKLYIILEILNELEIFQIKNDSNKYEIIPKILTKKIDLEQSKFLIDIRKQVSLS